jgi:hypothetical protein
MKKILFIILSFISLCSIAQNNEYSKLKVFLKEGGLQSLAIDGLAIDHGHHKAGVFVINDFSASEKALLDELNYEYEVLIKDVTKNYLETRNQTSKLAQECNSISGPAYQIPENFTLGSVGGYFTYDEILGHLENMQNLYPDLISLIAPINDSLTHDGNPLYWVKISDNPEIDEDGEPELLYTALHHAREPGSVSQLIFYMYYLLENYGSSSQITSIINNAELYFVPIINPDGYLYNEYTDPSGGGMWRKNRRNNNDGSFGVDLNRNYSFHWAEDDFGSSPNTNTQTYRGPGPASEPETQMINDFCINHHFELALNYHAYGGLFIYPWGYADPSLTPDSSSFFAFGQHLTQHNHYTYGTGSETVGYTVNGDSDDWMYGEETVKNKILTMTPEAGAAFWENTDQIIPTCLENLFTNIGIASILFPYADVETDAVNVVLDLEGLLNVSLQNIGLQEGVFNLHIETDNPYVTLETESTATSNLMHLQEELIPLSYTLSDDIPNNTIVELNLVVDNGNYESIYPITFTYGSENAFWTNDGNSLDEWSTDTWGISYTDYYSFNGSITDSPNGDYAPNSVNEIFLNDTIDLTMQSTAELSFYTKWNIENGWDYAQVSVSTDYGNSWQAMCGLYTKDGNEYQDFGQPIYDGSQNDWVQESIDLDDYIGEFIMLKFSLVSDGYVEEDGFYFDDLKITGSTEVGLPELNNNFSIYPNPSNGIINLKLTHRSTGSIQITNINGQVVLEDFIEKSNSFYFDASYLDKGVYMIKYQEMNQIWIKH